MFNSTSLDLPTHIHRQYGKQTSTAYNAVATSPLRTAKHSLEIILNNQDSKQIFYFLLLNLSYMFIQLAYGVWTNSLGLISDAIHMFFDCLALGVGLFATVMSKWPSNNEFSYGYNRIETVAAYFNGVFLVLISISIIAEAIQRLIVPPQMNTHRLLFISSVGLIVNLVGIFAFNHGHAHGGHGHDHHGHNHAHSANMRGVFLHIMADTLGSLGVIVSTILIQWFGWTGFDPIASLFIAVLIILSVIPLINQASSVMMLELDDSTVAAVEGTLEELRTMEGVHSISHVRFWPIESESIIGSIHVHVKDDANTQVVRQQTTELLKSHIHGLKEVCVQVELQSAMKRNKFSVPQKGFFHTPIYSGISSMNNAYVNHRPTAGNDNSFIVNHHANTNINHTIHQPSIATQNSMLPSSLNQPTINVMNVLQKQTKKE